MAAEATCERCGEKLGTEDRFCVTCGHPRAAEWVGGGATLQAKLDQALAVVHRILDDVANGRLHEGDLQSQLFRAGLVVHDDIGWMLDLEQGRWCRYDGVEVRLEPPGEAGAEAVPPRLSHWAAEVARLAGRTKAPE